MDAFFPSTLPARQPMQRIYRPTRKVAPLSLAQARSQPTPQWRHFMEGPSRRRPPGIGNLEARPAWKSARRRAYTTGPSPRTSPSRAQLPKKVITYPKLPLTLALITTGVISYYLGQLYVAVQSTSPENRVIELSQQTDVASRYDVTADNYDAEVGLSEWLMGILSMRKELARSCKGHVLEVSCGTGRNLGYFDVQRTGQVDSLTFVDLSAHMVELCKKKWLALYGGSREKKLKPGLVIRFLTASALSEMPLAPTSSSATAKKYDTIIQTMGLCSTPNPGDLVKNMASYLDTTNPDARIYLLEHGRSYREWLNNILDSSAAKHAEVHGCWFNREIGEIVETAARECGLEIVRERRRHIGTTWMFELKPKAISIASATAKEDTEPTPAAGGSTDRSWRSWIPGLSSRTSTS